jgi:hypothetical protein
MLLTMLGVGFSIWASFWLLWIKLPLIIRLKALGHPFLLDLLLSSGVFILYGGTGTGIAAATLAAIVLSLNINFARKLFGYYEKDDAGEYWYVIGKMNMSDAIVAEMRKRNGA